MRNFPVIQDLVVDISDFMAKLPSVKPNVRHDEPVEDGEYWQTPAELDAFKQFSMCINFGHVVLLGVPPVYALTPTPVWRRHALGQRYNLTAIMCGGSQDVLAAADGVCAPWWRMFDGSSCVLPARSAG